MKLIIIGAGVSGLATAYTIHQHAPHISLHCIEKSRGLGGRAATRRRDGRTSWWPQLACRLALSRLGLFQPKGTCS